MTLTEFLLARFDEYEQAIVEVTSTYYDAPMSEDQMWADLEAKRQIVGIVGQLGGYYEPDAARIAPSILRFLALPYADHPDYREEWKP